MTYQLILCARDGCVLASDQREYMTPDLNAGETGEGAKVNLVRKIRIDPTGRYAWAFSGGPSSIAASGLLERKLATTDQDREIEQLLRESGDQAWANTATGPDTTSKIILANGRTNTLIRANISPMTTLDYLQGGSCVAGQTFSKASIYPQLFHSVEMSVDAVALMAVYAVWLANKLDPLLVAGLDVAVYRQQSGRFEFDDAEQYWQKAAAQHEKLQISFEAV